MQNNKLYGRYLPFLILFFSINTVFGQGIIVNEISQGTGGTKEFIELLVIGSSGAPTANVDLTNWIIDDNNGDFETSGVGVGIAPGYIQITGACLNSVKPGSLIVIYNDLDKNTNMPADDPTDADSDNVYIFPVNHACFQRCTTNPNAAPATTSYIPCTGALTAGTWDRMSFRNSGDVAQTRKPDGTFFHGFAYGNVTAPFPNFPSTTSSFNVGAMGAGRSMGLGCGNGAWESSSNFVMTSATFDTPGAANNAANMILRNEVTAGSFDYSDFNNADNCDGIILPVELISFTGARKNAEVTLNWKTTSETDNDYFDIEMSFDGQDFTKVGNVKGKGTTISLQKYDFDYQSESYQTQYYRLKQVDFDATSSYSPIIAIAAMQNGDLSFETYPQPIQEVLKLKIVNNKEEMVEVLINNTLGQLIYHQNHLCEKGTNELIIATELWSLGTYFVQIKNKNKVITKRILK